MAPPIRGLRSRASTDAFHGGPAWKVAEGNPSTAQVVRGQLQGNLVSLEDTDVVLTHFAGAVGHQPVSIIQSDPETGVGEHFTHYALHLDKFFFSQC